MGGNKAAVECVLITIVSPNEWNVVVVGGKCEQGQRAVDDRFTSSRTVRERARWGEWGGRGREM